MTIYELITTTMAAVGLVAVAANLRGMKSQLRLMQDQATQLRQSVLMSAETALDALFIPVTQAYVEHPELRAILSPEEDDPMPRDRDMSLRASAVAETLCDAMERSLNYRRDGLGRPAADLLNWIDDSFKNSTFLRSWLLTRAAWYSPELVEIARNSAAPT